MYMQFANTYCPMHMHAQGIKYICPSVYHYYQQKIVHYTVAESLYAIAVVHAYMYL